MSDDENDPLCCCEYFDNNNERYHMLECCCNCHKIFANPTCCYFTDKNCTPGKMLLTFQDRLRIPWREGARKISIDAIIPIFIIPLVIAIAAINFYFSLFIFITTPIFLGYSYYYLRRVLPKSKFFVVWTLCSIIYLIYLFETSVPLLEILPEENLALMLFTCLSLFFLFKTRQYAKKNFINKKLMSTNEFSDKAEEEISLTIDSIEEDNINTSNICENCRKFAPPRSFHCYVCQVCIIRRDHHSFWLDCCIGRANHKYYFMGLFFGFCALLIGSNLTLTAVCHPFLLFKFVGIHILMPDDCSQAYDQYNIGISFILSIYALLIAAFILIALIMQAFLISSGLTLSEWRQGQYANKKSLFCNWKNFIC